MPALYQPNGSDPLQVGVKVGIGRVWMAGMTMRSSHYGPYLSTLKMLRD